MSRFSWNRVQGRDHASSRTCDRGRPRSRRNRFVPPNRARGVSRVRPIGFDAAAVFTDSRRCPMIIGPRWSESVGRGVRAHLPATRTDWPSPRRGRRVTRKRWKPIPVRYYYDGREVKKTNKKKKIKKTPNNTIISYACKTCYARCCGNFVFETMTNYYIARPVEIPSCGRAATRAVIAPPQDLWTT